MKRELVRCALSAALAGLALAPATAQDTSAKAKMTPQQQAMTEAWTKAATPGPQHARFKEMEGTWKMTSKSFEDPSKPPDVSTGTSTFRLIMGGRYLQQDVQGTMMGQTFHGHGVTGYDNVTRKYQAFWIDDMGTAMMFMTGEADSSGKVVTFTGSMGDPMTGAPMAVRMVTRNEGAGRHVMQMYGGMPDGKEMLMLEVTYERPGP